MIQINDDCLWMAIFKHCLAQLYASMAACQCTRIVRLSREAG